MASLAHCVSQVGSIQAEVLSPIDFKKHKELTLELDHVKDELEQVPSHGPFLKNFKDQIVSLYGKIDESLISFELKRIQNEAKTIEVSLQSGNFKSVRKITESLRNHITSLWDHYRPSLEERRVLVFAEEMLKRAQNIGANEAILSFEEKQEVECALEGIGMALAEQDEKRAAFLFNALSEEQKKCLCSYLPQEERSGLWHEIKRAGHNDKIFLRKR